MNEIKVNKPLSFPIKINSDREYVEVAEKLDNLGYRVLGGYKLIYTNPKKTFPFNIVKLKNYEKVVSFKNPNIREIKRLQQLAGINEIKVNNPNKIHLKILNQTGKYYELILNEGEYYEVVETNLDFVFQMLKNAAGGDSKRSLFQYKKLKKELENRNIPFEEFKDDLHYKISIDKKYIIL